MLKKCILLTGVFFIFFYTGKAQVGIGTTTPHESSVLDIESSSKGVLIPRLSTANRDGISAPSVGLMIYNTTTNCIEVNNGTEAAPNWVCLTGSGSTGNTGSISTPLSSTGDIGYSNTDVFRNIKYRRSDHGNYLQNAWGRFHLGEDRKSVYNNRGILLSSSEKYQSYLSYRNGATSTERALESTVKVLAVEERLPGKTWKELEYVSTGSTPSELFLLSTEGEFYNFSFNQRALGYAKRGISVDNIDPTDDNKVVLVTADVYTGNDKYEAHQQFVDNNPAIKFNALHVVTYDNDFEYAVLAYDSLNNKFYSMGVDYSINTTQHTKLTANELFRTTTPATLKESYELKEADVINNVLEHFNTKFELGDGDDMTLWIDPSTRVIYIITTDGYANVINGTSTVRRIKFPVGVKPVGYSGEYQYSPILGNDGKIYDSGNFTASYSPYTTFNSSSQSFGGFNYTIQENDNPINLYLPGNTQLNNLNIKSIHGYRIGAILTTDSLIYRFTELSPNSSSATFTDVSTLYDIDPIARIVGYSASHNIVAINHTGNTFLIENNAGSSNAIPELQCPSKLLYGNLGINNKGEAVLENTGTERVYLFYNYTNL